MTGSLSLHTRASRRLRGSAGIIDLASVLMGVLVLGIVAAVAMVSIGGVLAFSDDATAQGDVHVARTAELSARVSAREFLPASELTAGKYMSGRPTLAVSTDTNRTCYVAVSASKTGAVFYGTSRDKTMAELVDPAAPGCLTATSVKALAKTVCTVALGSAGACTKWN